MNILPLLFIALLLGGDKISSFKDLLLKIDFPSFAPVFQLLGVDKKFVDFISSEEFTNSLSSGNLKSLLPLCAPLFTQNKQAEEDCDDEEQKPCDYFSPIKNVAPTDVGATIENLFN